MYVDLYDGTKEFMPASTSESPAVHGSAFSPEFTMEPYRRKISYSISPRHRGGCGGFWRKEARLRVRGGLIVTRVSVVFIETDNRKSRQDRKSAAGPRPCRRCQ